MVQQKYISGDKQINICPVKIFPKVNKKNLHRRHSRIEPPITG